ncbi:MAG TPA: HD domain-containing phosphohydrolase [Polyangiaceae bacterium]|nr:HD domain-containing phosphohydrolase [Polyangiaceae bacterium]
MLEEGRISPALASTALERHRTTGERFEEALIDCGLPESMLLRHLAEMFNTRFISTKTLSGAAVSRVTLQRLPRRLAERYHVLPIRFAEDDVLTVVATEPANPQLLENVRVAVGARLVTGLVARPAAIDAAIAKLYGGDGEPFARLLSLEPAVSGGGLPTPLVPEGSYADVQLDTSAFDAPGGFDGSGAFDGPGGPFDNADPTEVIGAPAALGEFGINGAESAFEHGAAAYDMAQNGAAFEPASAYSTAREAAAGFEASAPLLPEPPAAAPLGAPGGWVPSNEPDPEQDLGVQRARSAALGDASKLAESLMIIHERTRGSLKSHSVRVARLMYSLCQRLDLSEAQAAQAWAVGLFHDLGKSQQNHLTALNVWQLADYEVTARAQFKNPGRLLKNADVPETVITAIAHMYERFDGKGFPSGLAEEAIPFQSRMLALCDSVADLTLNPANTLGRIVSPLEACNHIRAQTPKVFDPTLLAHFSRLLVERKLDGAFLSDQSVHGIEKLLA